VVRFDSSMRSSDEITVLGLQHSTSNCKIFYVFRFYKFGLVFAPDAKLFFFMKIELFQILSSLLFGSL
jgi:hypothetical protein